MRWHSEQVASREELSNAIIDSLSENIAVLNKDGRILAVNRAWTEFARANNNGGLHGVDVETNYLDVCARAARENIPGSNVALTGIQRVMQGETVTFEMEYPGHSPGEERWFLMKVTPLRSEPGEVVVAHTDITEKKKAELRILRYQQELNDVTSRLIFAQENERNRLARELHDDYSQRLAALGMHLASVMEMTPDQAIRAGLTASLISLAGIATDLHQFARQLHSAILEDLGLAAALKTEVELLRKTARLSVQLSMHGDLDQIPTEVANCLYRIAQESLRNVVAHAEVKYARLHLRASPSEVYLMVRDRGVGFDRAACKRKGGLGLTSMEERVRLLNGFLKVNSQPGKGVRLEVRIPLSNGEGSPEQRL
jgi:signal transduction histidine kinase